MSAPHFVILPLCTPESVNLCSQITESMAAFHQEGSPILLISRLRTNLANGIEIGSVDLEKSALYNNVLVFVDNSFVALLCKTELRAFIFDVNGIRYEVILLAHHETALELMVATLIFPDGSITGRILISVAYPADSTVFKNVSLILIALYFAFLKKVRFSIAFPISYKSRLVSI